MPIAKRKVYIILLTAVLSLSPLFVTAQTIPTIPQNASISELRALIVQLTQVLNVLMQLMAVRNSVQMVAPPPAPGPGPCTSCNVNTDDVSFVASPVSGTAPLSVSFRSTSNTPRNTEGSIQFGDGATADMKVYAGDCIYCAPTSFTYHKYNSAGTYTAVFNGRLGSKTATITVSPSNTPTTTVVTYSQAAYYAQGAYTPTVITDHSANIWTSVSSTVDPTHLPLGDQKYVLDAPKVGYVYACDKRYFTFATVMGSRTIGSWVHGTTWDVTKKEFVHGEVNYPNATFSITTSGGNRVIVGNALPFGVPSGIFPTRTTDPAYAYDQNPSTIVAQAYSFSIPKDPTIAAAPSCMELDAGVTLDGIEFSGPLDSSGRDEVAIDMQDVCSGTAQPGGVYHRHGPSNCMPHIRENNALVGYAFDGFGIFSLYDAYGRELTTKDLDECHGTTSPIVWDGKQVNMYHYVLTRDFPYSPSCFRGTPVRNNFPPRPMPPAPSQSQPTTSWLPTTTCAMSVTPVSIYRGQGAYLNWTSSHADGVSIDNGVGYVETSGSRLVIPPTTTTYYCRGYIVNQGYGIQGQATLYVNQEAGRGPSKESPPEYIPTSMAHPSSQQFASALAALETALRTILLELGR